jgi:hypothetical protein
MDRVVKMCWWMRICHKLIAAFLEMLDVVSCTFLAPSLKCSHSCIEVPFQKKNLEM